MSVPHYRRVLVDCMHRFGAFHSRTCSRDCGSPQGSREKDQVSKSALDEANRRIAEVGSLRVTSDAVALPSQSRPLWLNVVVPALGMPRLRCDP